MASVGAMLTGHVGPSGSTAAAQTAETASAALDVVRKSISVDVHTHGGKTGITSKAPPNDDLANAMRAGSLAVACLADVPDGPILGRNAEGVLAAVRTPEPGQLYRHHLERLAWMDETVANHGLRRALCAADLEAAHKAGQPAIVADVEGLDFLDGKLERLEEAHQRGIRHLQLVHYTPNDIGDFQTGAITHQGLTSFGAEVIRACHRLGFICDISHATEDMVKQAVKIATKPLLLSHAALSGSRAMGPTPLQGRQITPDHARAIAETGSAVVLLAGAALALIWANTPLRHSYDTLWSTRLSIRRSKTSGIGSGRLSDSTRRVAHHASRRPPTAPSSDITRASVTSCCTNRPRLAPNCGGYP